MKFPPRLALVAVTLTPALILAKTVNISPLEATTTIYEMNDRHFGGTLAVTPLADNKIFTLLRTAGFVMYVREASVFSFNFLE